MDNERKILDADTAIAMLPDDDDIHTFRNPAGMLLGCDCKREWVIDKIRKHQAELAGEMATRMKHGLVVRDEDGLLFIATK